MKKQILLGFILLFISKQNYSQTNIKDSIRVPKNEIGTNLVPLISILTPYYNPNSLNGSIFYKRKITPNLYYRLGVSLYNTKYHYYNNDNINMPETHINSGLEYRWGKKNIKYFTGADLGYSYLKSTSTFLNPGDTITNSYKTIRQGITITPFIGMQYHFSKKFFFSMQVGPELGYVFGSRKPVISNTPNYLPLKFKEYSLTGGLLGNFSLFYKF